MPQRPATPVLNRSHPLARGLVGLWAPVAGGTGKIRDLSGQGRDLTIGGSSNAITAATNALGRGVRASATTYFNSTEATLRDVPAVKNFTMAYVGSATGGAAVPAAMGWYGTDDILLYPWRTDGGTAPAIFWRDVSGTDAAGTGALTDGRPHSFAFSSYATSDHRFYTDGIRRVTDTSSRAGAGPFTGFFILAWPDTTTQDLNDCAGNVSNLFAVWNRALSAREHAEFAADPFAMLRAPERVVVAPVAAGGGGSVSVTPAALALTLTGHAPTILTPRTVAPGALALTLTGHAPTVLTPRTVTPGALGLTLTGHAPTVQTPRTVTPGALALTLTGHAPTVVTPRTVAPGALALIWTGHAPTVSVAGGSAVVEPGPLALVWTGHAPTVTATGGGSGAGGSGKRAPTARRLTQIDAQPRPKPPRVFPARPHFIEFPARAATIEAAVDAIEADDEEFISLVLMLEGVR